MIEVLEPGYHPTSVEYRAGWDLQQSVHDEVVAGSREETLVLLEHASVFTAGIAHRAAPSAPRTPASL